MTVDELEKKIHALEKRNARVDENKAWETSWTRKVGLVIITYLVIVLTLFTIRNPSPLINAIIPAVGFFLSTLSLPFIKKYWSKHFYATK